MPSMTLAEYQTKTNKGDRVSGDLAPLLRSADLGVCVTIISLQAKRLLTGTHDVNVARQAVSQALWFLTRAATNMGISLETAAEESLETDHGV